MTRFIRSLVLSAAALVAPIASSLCAQSAAAQSHDLCEISDQYRDAALAFERHVYRSKYLDSYDERLADRLEAVAREFRSAARNPRDVQRLLYHWQDLAATHFRVEETVVRAHASCDQELLRCWQPVAETFTCLAAEMKCFAAKVDHEHHDSSNFGYGNGYEYSARPPFPSRAVPNGYFAPEQDYRSQFNPGFQHTPFGVQPNFGNDRPSNQLRSNGPVYPSRQSAQVDPRREIGAAIAVSILNRLFD